jgi:hypothetical protein
LDLRDVVRPGPSRGLDFVVLDELNKRTGIEAKDVLSFGLSELLCNALDEHDATEINIDVQTVGDFDVLTVSDNGKRKFKRSDLELVVDFENKASSKRGFMQVSRGILGNALKCLFGYSYALAESRELVPQPITISSTTVTYTISISPNKIGQVIESQITEIPRIDDRFTSVKVSFPANRDRTLSESMRELRDKIRGSGNVNPTRKITFNLYGEKGTTGIAQGGQEIRQETSVLWYTSKQFIELFEDYLRTSPDTQVKDFIEMFRGFSRKTAIRDILQEVNGPNVDAKAQKMQFVPSSPLKDLSDHTVKRLFQVMKSRSKPISKRSIPDVLGCVGQEYFERLRQQHGWFKLRYVYLVGIKKICPEWSPHNLPCKNLEHVEFPYLVELAIFDRNDSEGLQLYEAVNFMASSHDVFSNTFNIQYRLGCVRIAKSSSVTIIAHVVSPVLPWLNYGKTSLGSIDPHGLMEQAFNKLLPIPKTPREYLPPSPPRPLSWVPRGQLHDPKYEQRLRLFASEIKAIDARRTYHRRPRMRGWGYLLEGLGLITKGEFDAVAKAINDCRKMGEKHGGLPMDIIAPDPDESRKFKGIHRAANPKVFLEELRNDVKEMLESLPSNITDFFAGEKYYLMMVVEKGEVFDIVFGPICKGYFVPHVSSKGWSNLEIRANIAKQCLWAVAHGLTPVLLLFYDLDPKGIEMADTFRKNLKDMERATGWNPDNMIIERFGLNKEQIDKFKLSWIPNLQTSKGHEPKRTRKVVRYIKEIGEKKCEIESLFKNDETLRAAEQICRDAIEKYYGPDAKERFQKKELESKGKLHDVYDSPVWTELDAELTRIEEALADQEPKEAEATPNLVQEQETEVIVDGRHCGRCPRCRNQFDYDETKGNNRLVRCRNCQLLMRLKLKTATDQNHGERN